MSDTATRARAAWLAAIAEQGWRRACLADAARLSGLTEDEVRTQAGDPLDWQRLSKQVALAAALPSGADSIAAALGQAAVS